MPLRPGGPLSEPAAAAVAEPRHASDPLRIAGAPDVVQTRVPLQAPPRRERIVLPEKDVVVEVEADDGEVAEIRGEHVGNGARDLVLGVKRGGRRREEKRRQEEQNGFSRFSLR